MGSNLANLNKNLLCKWSWRFTNEKGALWNDVIREKYGPEEGGYLSCVVRVGHGVGYGKQLESGDIMLPTSSSL